MSTRWPIIKVQVNIFHGYHHELKNIGIAAQPLSTAYVRGCPFSCLFLCDYT
jgi:hypothetical protein